MTHSTSRSGCAARSSFEHRGRERADVDLFEAHRLARGAREAEQLVDERRHALGRTADPLQVLDVILGELVGGVLQDHLAEAVDGAERRP